MKQEQRSVVASERQWIIPILFQVDPTDFENRLRVVDEILVLDISSNMKSYLSLHRKAIYEAKEKNNAQLALEQSAIAERERQERIAEAERLKAVEYEEEQKLQELQAAREAEEAARLAARVAQEEIAVLQKQRESEIEKAVMNLTRTFRVF